MGREYGGQTAARAKQRASAFNDTPTWTAPYDLSRQFAPYIGAEYASTFGDTGDFRRAAGDAKSETRLVAGLRIWF